MLDVTVPLASIGEVGPSVDVHVVDASPTVVAGAMLDVVVGTISVGAVVALVEDRSLVVDIASSVVSTVVVVNIGSFVV